MDLTYSQDMANPEEYLPDVSQVPTAEARVETAEQQVESFHPQLVQFLSQAETGDLTTSHYIREFMGCRVKVSFGQGGLARIPWIGVTAGENTISNGIYPNYLYFKESGTLLLVRGVSEENRPKLAWKSHDEPTVSEFFQERNLTPPSRYGASHVYKHYDASAVVDANAEFANQIDTDLRQLINEYLEILQVNEGAAQIEIPSIDEEVGLNTILYGPPGTGKTYHSTRLALDIIHTERGYSASIPDREVAKEFQALRESDRVEFITFHQSYGYEEFIEGIRPVLDSDKLTYEMRTGVFKKMANLAAAEYTKPDRTIADFSKAQFFKMSLGATWDPEESGIYDYCIQNDVIALGWAKEVDFTDVLKGKGSNWQVEWKAIKEKFAKEAPEESIAGPQALYAFGLWMKVGDIVFISKGNTTIRAIGRITGEYEFRPSDEISYPHFRNVEWLMTDLELPAEKISKKPLTMRSIYNLKPENLDLEAIARLLDPNSSKGPAKNYVLIIDEINRGNISKIFGELITLIEEDKRLNALNEIHATLPYSGNDLVVPPNLYIIGTMNTADRSIALIDLALRRRFRFQALYPDETLVPENLREFFTSLNESIRQESGVEYQVGHSYFMKIDSSKHLAEVMNEEIIPLLYEYFQDQGDDVRKVLSRSGAISEEIAGRVQFVKLQNE
jgi:5-methylcytosine-specific restriction protein B